MIDYSFDLYFHENYLYPPIFRLMPESALTTTKEKKLSGRQWFESGRASVVLDLPPNFSLSDFMHGICVLYI